MIVTVLAISFIQPQLADTLDAKSEQTQLNKSEVAEPVKADAPKTEPTVDPPATETPAPEQPAKVVQETQSTPVTAVTCEQAIRQVWPSHLQQGAITVSQHENRAQEPNKVSEVNPDGHSRDYGCFQINDYWHPAYFTDGDWKDPVWAATYALKIYEGRQNSSGNGWKAWYAVEGVLW